MARCTNVKTREVRKQLREAGFALVRNGGGHEIWRRGQAWTRLSAGHREVDANELRLARRAMEEGCRSPADTTAARAA